MSYWTNLFQSRVGLCLVLSCSVGSIGLPAIALAQGTCSDCAGDLTGDNKVNMEDFAILAENWMRPCDQIVLPVFIVTKSGLTKDGSQQLARSLGIEGTKMVWDKGAAVYIDPDLLGAVPMTEVRDPGVLAQIPPPADDEGPITAKAFDFAALKELQVPDDKSVLTRFRSALADAGLGLDNATPEVVHTMFEAVDVEGKPIIPLKAVDTRINYSFALGGLPLVGPGANVRVSFAPGGAVSQLMFSTRNVVQGDPVAVISPEDAARRCAMMYPDYEAKVSPKLGYFAPSMNLPNVKALVPCYECGGTAPVGGREYAVLLERFIPATDDPEYVPQIDLTVEVLRGNLVSAMAKVGGGLPPYRYTWSSSSVDLSGLPEDQYKIQYLAKPRDPKQTLERLTLAVTDDNGVTAYASRTVVVAPAPAQDDPIEPPVEGVVDIGIERAVSDLGGIEQSGYVNRFAAEGGIYRRFNWTGADSWEKDFREGGTGIDSQYCDNVDEVFYIGHGGCNGFTFVSNHDDGDIAYWEVPSAWGDTDVEWMALLSCQVLRNACGTKDWTRWCTVFDGLHLLLGFETNARAETNFGYAFADWQLGRNFVVVTVTLSVRAAWFQAKAETQPNDRIAVVMGPIGPNGIANYDDYFWNQGPTGPDIRGSNIRGYWRVSYK